MQRRVDDLAILLDPPMLEGESTALHDLNDDPLDVGGCLVARHFL
jgi:hypothetical protein